VRGRSYTDWSDALAYAVWFLVNGRVGSRADREYLEQERSRRRFLKMTDILYSYQYGEGAADEDDLEDERATLFAPRVQDEVGDGAAREDEEVTVERAGMP